MRKYNFTKDILLHSSDIKKIGFRINAEIGDFYKDKKELVIITVLDGAHDFQRLIFSSGMMPKDLHIVYKSLSAKSYGDETHPAFEVMINMGSAARQEEIAECIKGRHVLIIDDIYDTGRTLEAVTSMLKENSSPLSIEHCVMINRNCEHLSDIKPRFIGESVDTMAFLVGMGLDYKGDFRFLPYVATVDPDFSDPRGPYDENICNKCGESCESPEARKVEGPMPSNYGLINATASGYYYSPVLEDCVTYKFDICEKCLKEFFNTFTVPVEERERSPFEA
jgi:hypoxanthine phosphoribosyltransferase